MIHKVLESIAPPYTSEFVQLFLPMVENEEITGTMRGDGDSDLVSDFIGILTILLEWTFKYSYWCCSRFLVYCKANYVVVS